MKRFKDPESQVGRRRDEEVDENIGTVEVQFSAHGQ